MKERRKKTKKKTKKTKGSNYGGKEERRGRSGRKIRVSVYCSFSLFISYRYRKTSSQSFANAAASIGYMTPNLVP